MKLALSVLTIVSLVAGSGFAADTKKNESKPSPAPKSAPAPRQEAPRQKAPVAARQQAPAPRPPAPKKQDAPAPKQQPSKKEDKPTRPAAQPKQPVAQPKPSPAPAPSHQTMPPAQSGSHQVPPVTQKPTPVTPKPRPVSPVAQKPVIHAPPAAKPVTAKPAQIQQRQQQETAAAKAKVPAVVAAKIPAGATAKVNKNNTVTIRDSKGNTKVVDATTGKQRMSYNAQTGKSVYTPPSGAKTVVNGNQTVRTAPGGYKQIETRQANGNKTIQTSVRGSTVVKNYTSSNTYVTNKTVIVNNKTVIINENRNYVVVNNGFGRVPVYRATWWGAPRSWVVGNVVVFDAFYPRVGFVSPYWGMNGGFVMFANPYACVGGCWASYSWYGDRYYAGYYVAPVSYPSIGDYMVDSYIQAQLENDRMMRLAAMQADANYQAEQDAFAAQNNPAINPGNQPIPSDLRETLVEQFQTEVAATQQGTPLYASDMIAANDGSGDGHVFGVDDPMTEDTMVGENSYQCQLGHGDFLVQDPNADVDTESALDADGNVQLDDNGNVINETYVTMTVKKSKTGDCAEGLDVVVQVETLQSMVDEEAAQAQKAMERAVSLNIGQ